MFLIIFFCVTPSLKLVSVPANKATSKFHSIFWQRFLFHCVRSSWLTANTVKHNGVSWQDNATLAQWNETIKEEGFVFIVTNWLGDSGFGNCFVFFPPKKITGWLQSLFSLWTDLLIIWSVTKIPIINLQSPSRCPQMSSFQKNPKKTRLSNWSE